ncbi:DNA/RNA non-specific endonuclease [Hymenobacter sp. BT188]|uniref:DNA/RNA non-specific endonuclease n=1 Tax=Hymenobacter sp. BT188 TaxID=2763504 RepID=UPI0016513971|nr:DNA/RNA non-specific endonuclease [Hymenobacter sp. BT188]MBC6605749.1 DNA/RNA non-specific endonuclease [Hymenobacter sp. BT188]
MKRTVTRLSTLLVLLTLAVSCSKDELVAPIPSPTAAPSSQDATRDSHLALGNPSGAIADPYYYWNYLLVKPQFTMSYHRDRGVPNWVSWHLSSAWLGSTPRQDNFSTDASLPTGWYRVTSTSYSGSGFDRGHLCPSADRTASIADNSATFKMTNMMPQAPTNNQQTWANLENYCRTLVGQGYELYVIAGSYGKGGTGSAGYKTTLDAGRVTVPARTWKVVVVLPEGSSDASRVSTGTRVIAVDMPNTNTLSTSWGSYRTTVDAIESATGYNILSAVSSTVQSTVEARVDAGPTN